MKNYKSSSVINQLRHSGVKNFPAHNSNSVSTSIEYFNSEKTIIPEHTALPIHNSGNIHLGNFINNLIKQIMIEYPIKINFKCFGSFETLLSDRLKHNIFNIVQEYLNTILNREKVSEINIGLSQNQNRLMLSIADDSLRFDASKGTGRINVKSMPGLQTENLNLICNPHIGNCLIYHQNYK